MSFSVIPRGALRQVSRERKLVADVCRCALTARYLARTSARLAARGSCRKGVPAAMSEPVDARLLARSWTHSHEEDFDGWQVFRPSEQGFPPSRGRSSLELVPGGALKSSGPGADDRTVRGEGRWELRDRTLVVRSGGGVQSFEVGGVEPDRLLLRPMGG
jgi:hypothetical protein